MIFTFIKKVVLVLGGQTIMLMFLLILYCLGCFLQKTRVYLIIGIGQWRLSSLHYLTQTYYCPLIEITTTTISLSFNIKSVRQSGALSLVGRVEIVLSLVESFIELKYFHDVATPALLYHKEPARRIQSPLLGAGSLWHKRAGGATS